MSISFQSSSKLLVSARGVSVGSALEIGTMDYTPTKYCQGWQVGSNGHMIKLKRDAVAVCKLLKEFGAWEFTALLALEDYDGYIIEEERECYITGGGVSVKANRSHFERVAHGDIEFSESASDFIKETLIKEIK